MTPPQLTENPSDDIISDRTDSSNLSLTKRVRAGLSWNVSFALINESIRFVRSITLARLLVPEDFGLFAMALTSVGALNAITSLGLSRTVVASKFDSNDQLKAHLDTVWSVELLRGVAIGLLLIASAFPISWFYGQEQLKVVIPVLGSIALINGFQNIGLALLRKEISFARIFWYELTTNVTGVVLTVLLAVVMRNVWALVIGMLLTSVLGTVLSYFFHPYRPRLSFERNGLRRVLNVGKFTLLIAIASYVMNMGDNVMVGRLLGSGALGNYSLAFNISSAPISVLVLSVTSVLFPAYAKLTSERPRDLDLTFTKVFSLVLVVVVTIASTLFLLGDEVVQILFGDRWATAGTVLCILALIIPLRTFTLLVSTLFWGVNRPKDVAVCTAFEALIFLVALYPSISALGLTGAAWAGIIAYGLGSINRMRPLGQIMPGISTKLLQISISVCAVAGGGFLLAWLSLRFVSSPLPRIFVGTLLCAGIPALTLFWLNPQLKRSLVE